MCDGDVAADGIQFGATSDLPGANVAAPGAQRSLSRDVAHIDVAAAGHGREISGDIQHLNVPAFGLQFGGGASPRSVSDSRRTDAARFDVSALSVQESGPTEISRSDVTCLGDPRGTATSNCTQNCASAERAACGGSVPVISTPE
jgi:hypothetical protein